ncbi:membrane or secreted protein [Pedobacter sp. GR22-10]|uniref:membrane or secreted protein n=1 Tax=Pedobacter sp. GR22-10 TaxID=2994472 RepID=UPI00224657F8|nr:membrane or secreted protein [Pedobacter sp. GR22-10]MCX2429439.1 membrane or secreted protein [Pedobacter sp. GR22-10]
MILNKQYLFILAFILMSGFVRAQNKQGIYVDAKGVIRWEKNHQEAAFFGTNYTVPFAYGNRAILKTGITAEQAIKDDVYHFSRLGLDAFRVHVWDTEISDSLGNLLNNEHLRLFDFLLAELKKRKIKTLVTPIAFWGNGYPEKDERTGSFSSKYGKHDALTNEAAFKAQENYLKQFFKHKNPYTGLTYQQDADILATEVNNEPQHSGAPERTTEYINRMVSAIKSTGWSKPIFYNISESPKYAAAIVKADVQGHSFQWYPTGLVAGHTLKGNFLPNVAAYKIPFDTIPAFANRAKVVYEFDAGDVMTPIMYPAMAKSFRAAGFQWATQFAYDPMATAYANTEYQTHYLNLAYTPSKAISLLIASKAFHQLPRLFKSDSETCFGAFKLDYKKALSEMNTEEAFYYTNSTVSKPVNTQKIKHIAGVGSSPVVQYQGNGAYFIDQVAKGIWRLEVMPDAIPVNDPFAKASPQKTVTQIDWKNSVMEVQLNDLGAAFEIKGLNAGNQYAAQTKTGRFNISPGSYLLIKKGLKSQWKAKDAYENIVLGDFVAPKASLKGVFVKHQPLKTASENVDMALKMEIFGLDQKDSAYMELNNAPGQWKSMGLNKIDPYHFTAIVPAEMLKPGVLNYRVMVHQANGKYHTFPGNVPGTPDAWDKLETESYQTYVGAKNAHLEVLNPESDRNNINIYNPDWKNNKMEFTSSENPLNLELKLSMNAPEKAAIIGFQSFIADYLSGRMTDLSGMSTLVIRMKSNLKNTKVKVGLIDTDAHFFSKEISADHDFREIEIPLNQLKADQQLLLPRPYPGFLPLYYQSPINAGFDLNRIEKLEVTFGYSDKIQPVNLTISSVYFK